MAKGKGASQQRSSSQGSLIVALYSYVRTLLQLVINFVNVDGRIDFYGSTILTTTVEGSHGGSRQICPASIGKMMVGGGLQLKTPKENHFCCSLGFYQVVQ